MAKRTNLLKQFLFIATVMLLPLHLFCFTVDEAYGGGSEKPRFTDEKAMATADDSKSIIIKQFSPEFRKGYDEAAQYIVLCEHEDQILYEFQHDYDFLKNKGYTELSLTKLHEFEHVTLYELVFGFNDSRFINSENNLFNTSKERGKFLVKRLVWLDNTGDKYYRAFYYDPSAFLSGVVDGKNLIQDYYLHVRDLYTYLLNNEFEKAEKALDNNESFDTLSWLGMPVHILRMMRVWDEDIYERYKERFYRLNERGSATKLFNFNVQLLEKYYSMPYNVESYEDIWVAIVVKNSTFKPKITGSLPVNEAELSEYIAWLKDIYTLYSYKHLLDAYEVEVKFELVPEGLKLVSAGRDKEFNTIDDHIFVRTYESVGMKPLN